MKSTAFSLFGWIFLSFFAFHSWFLIVSSLASLSRMAAPATLGRARKHRQLVSSVMEGRSAGGRRGRRVAGWEGKKEGGKWRRKEAAAATEATDQS